MARNLRRSPRQKRKPDRLTFDALGVPAKAEAPPPPATVSAKAGAAPDDRDAGMPITGREAAGDGAGAGSAAFKAVAVVLVVLGLALTQPELRELSADGIASGRLMLRNFVQEFENQLLGAGVWGPLYLFGVYFVTTIFMLPLWGFHVTTGYAYGTFRAALLISVTQALCAGAAFSTSRYIMRPYIRGFLRKKYGQKFDAIDRAVSQNGLKTTILLRLSPIIPFGVNNYLCGCTGIKLWQWVLGTWIGVLPGTTAYCNVGALGKIVGDGNTTSLQKAVMGLQVCAALGAVYYLNKLATKALEQDGIGSNEEVKKVKSQ